MYNIILSLLVTPDKKRKTESICESSGIKPCSSQELHVSQPLNACVSACTSASVCVCVCVTDSSRPAVGDGDPNTVVFICNLWDGVKPAIHQSHSVAATQQKMKRKTFFNGFSHPVCSKHESDATDISLLL